MCLRQGTFSLTNAALNACSNASNHVWSDLITVVMIKSIWHGFLGLPITFQVFNISFCFYRQRVHSYEHLNFGDICIPIVLNSRTHQDWEDEIKVSRQSSIGSIEMVWWSLLLDQTQLSLYFKMPDDEIKGSFWLFVEGILFSGLGSNIELSHCW